MARTSDMEWSGGCLCGAIRYRASQAPHYASYCHCGMCRKISGAPFTGFVEFPLGAIEWLQGHPQPYSSSSGVIRRFCQICGSFLTFESAGVTFFTLGSLDTQEKIRFHCHTYMDFRLPGMPLSDGLPQYPGPRGGKGGRPID